MNERNSGDLAGRVVEVHLVGGKRFIGKVRRQIRDGVLLYGVPVRVLDSFTSNADMRDELNKILSTVFIPYVSIEYVDVGGEPIGFDALYSGWFGGQSLESYFTHPMDRGNDEE